VPLPEKEVPLLVARPFSPALSSAPEALQDLTALSGVLRRPSLPEGHFLGLGALARRSLQAFLFAVLAPGCLVTAEPVTYEPQQTPPILVASGLDPDPRSVLRVGGDLGLLEFPIVASVASEDAGESVKSALYIDYGFQNPLKQPFRNIFANFAELPAATLADGPRPLVGVLYNAGVVELDPGCHRLTLVVTHEFDTRTGCPKDLRDSSQITWHFRQCGVGDCLPVLENCPATEVSCPLDPTVVTSDANDAGTTGG